MINKVKNKIKQHFKLNRENNRLLKELYWANVYSESIRGKKWLSNTPLNIGRWAGSYTFFYLLNRILSDYQPKRILELGLGESSKFISKYLDNFLKDSKHVVVEHDSDWRDAFCNKFKLSDNSKINIHPLKDKIVKDFKVNSYDNFDIYLQDKFDLYIIDGPFGSKNYSRYEIVDIANEFNEKDEFIIIYDDYNRNGEKETAQKLKSILRKKGISIYYKVYSGEKDILIIGTEKFKHITSL